MRAFRLPYPQVSCELNSYGGASPTNDGAVQLDAEVFATVYGGSESLGHTVGGEEVGDVSNGKGMSDYTTCSRQMVQQTTG